MCDQCKQRPATVRLTMVIDGQVQEKNLCHSCLDQVQQSVTDFNLNGLVGFLSNFLSGSYAPQQEFDPNDVLKCSECGTTYKEFRESGLLGCAHCYAAFAAPLEEILKSVHGNIQHVGSGPENLKESVSDTLKLDQLKQELQQAILTEEYERAAELRDRIRLMEKGQDLPEAQEEIEHEQ